MTLSGRSRSTFRMPCSTICATVSRGRGSCRTRLAARVRDERRHIFGSWSTGGARSTGARESVAQPPSAVPRRHRRHHDPLRASSRSARRCAGAARHARLAAHVRPAAGLRRPPAGLPRGGRQPPRFRVLGTLRRRPCHGTAARIDDARLMTEMLGYRRYLTYGEDVSANVNDLVAATLSGSGRRHPGHPRPFPVARGASRRSRLPTSARSSTASQRRMSPTVHTVTCRRPARHARRCAERLAGRAARLARREARRVERHAPRRPRRRRAAHLARAHPHRGDALLGHADDRLVVPAVLRGSRPARADPARGGAGRRVHPAARGRLPRVARPPVTTAICACSSASTKAGISPWPRFRRRWPPARAPSRRTSDCSSPPGGDGQAARPRRSSSGWMSASRPRKSR